MNCISITHLPLLLTVSRIVLSPLLLTPLLVFAGSADSFLVWLIATAVFVLLCATDFVDGYIARTYQLETACGRLLDPIGDKFLVISALVGLLATSCISWGWVLLFLCRDMFVMGLRLAAEQQKIRLHVSFLAKIKTTVLMCALVLVTLQQLLACCCPGLVSFVVDVSFAFLLVAGALGVVTALFYTHQTASLFAMCCTSDRVD